MYVFDLKDEYEYATWLALQGDDTIVAEIIEKEIKRLHNSLAKERKRLEKR